MIHIPSQLNSILELSCCAPRGAKLNAKFSVTLGLLATLVYSTDLDHDVLYVALFVYLLPSTSRPTN
jgi:hypothetical protein